MWRRKELEVVGKWETGVREEKIITLSSDGVGVGQERLGRNGRSPAVREKRYVV